MSETIAEMVARHAGGGRVVDTIEATLRSDRGPRRPRPLHRAAAEGRGARGRREAGRARAARAGRSYGVPFAVKDNIDVAGLPTTAACPAFAYAPATSSVRRRAAASGRRHRHRQDQSRSVRHRPRRRALALWRAAQCAARATSFPADRVPARRSRSAAGLVPLCARHRHRGLGPRAGRAQQHRRPQADARRAVVDAASCRPAARSTASRSSRSTSPTLSPRFAGRGRLRRRRSLFANRSPRRASSPPPPHFRVGVPPAASAMFFGDAEAERAYRAPTRTLARLGATTRRVRYRAVLRSRAAALRGALGRRALRRDQALIEARAGRDASGDAQDHRGRAQVRRGRRASRRSTGSPRLRRTTRSGLARVRRAGAADDADASTRAPRCWPIRSRPTRSSAPTPISSICSTSAAIAYPSGMRADGLPSA